MKKRLTGILSWLSSATLVMLLSGCVTGKNLVEAMSKLGNDPATVTMKFNGWGASIEITRTNPNTNTPPLTAGGPSGVSVKSVVPIP